MKKLMIITAIALACPMCMSAQDIKDSQQQNQTVESALQRTTDMKNNAANAQDFANQAKQAHLDATQTVADKKAQLTEAKQAVKDAERQVAEAKQALKTAKQTVKQIQAQQKQAQAECRHRPLLLQLSPLSQHHRIHAYQGSLRLK